MVVAFVAAWQLGTTRSEEGEGRLDNFLVRPVARWSWLAGRLLVASAVLVLGGVLAGIFTWLGAASQSSGVSFAKVFEAGLNIIPPALCVLGIGALVFGLLPRLSSLASYGVLVWSVLVELVGGVVGLNHWVLDTSVFHQMADAPAANPDWASACALLGVGAVAALCGVAAFSVRDLSSE